MDHQQKFQLSEALQSAFAPNGFDRMLAQRVGKTRHHIVGDQEFAEIVFQVIEAADREKWLAKLISAALEANPNNPQLLAFVQRNPEYDPDRRKADLPHNSREAPWLADHLPRRQQTKADSLIETRPQEGFVFFCYARADEEFCLRLAKSVKDRGVHLWVDQWNIAVSADWDRSIDEALSKCEKVLVVLSPSSVNSDEVRTELQTAFMENKPVVPVLYQKCTIPRRLRLTQYIDFVSVPPNDEVKVEQLLQALRSRKK